MALLLLMNVGSTVGFWTIGVMTFTGGGTVGQTLRSIFSINVAAVAAALLVCFLRIPIPEPIAYTCKYLCPLHAGDHRGGAGELFQVDAEA